MTVLKCLVGPAGVRPAMDRGHATCRARPDGTARIRARAGTRRRSPRRLIHWLWARSTSARSVAAKSARPR